MVDAAAAPLTAAQDALTWLESSDEGSADNRRQAIAVLQAATQAFADAVAAVPAGEWRGPVDAAFADRVGAGRLGALVGLDDPVGWALDVLGLDGSDRSQTTVRRRFRELLREAHPDQGGRDLDAADRIREAGPRRHHAHPGLLRQAAPGLGHMCRRLLVARVDHAEVRVDAAIQQGKDVFIASS